MKAGSLVARGGVISFLGIGTDVGPLTKQLLHLRSQLNIKVQREIHEEVGEIFKQEMKDNITSQKPKVLRVRRGHQKPYNVPKGTYKRSIAYWLINDRESSYWVGPRVGRKVGRYKDAWFANIVEGDDQFIPGNNRNKDVMEKSIRNVKGQAFNLLAVRYRQAIERAARAKKARGTQLKLF